MSNKRTELDQKFTKRGGRPKKLNENNEPGLKQAISTDATTEGTFIKRYFSANVI